MKPSIILPIISAGILCDLALAAPTHFRPDGPLALSPREPGLNRRHHILMARNGIPGQAMTGQLLESRNDLGTASQSFSSSARESKRAIDQPVESSPIERRSPSEEVLEVRNAEAAQDHPSEEEMDINKRDSEQTGEEHAGELGKREAEPEDEHEDTTALQKRSGLDKRFRFWKEDILESIHEDVHKETQKEVKQNAYNQVKSVIDKEQELLNVHRRIFA